jgi:hypothetical protein
MTIFEIITQAKKTVLDFSEQSKSRQWISENDFINIKSSLDKEKITIGVVGQMKNGKSTLLNALIFENPVLPSATTPMTSSLSVITYGEKPSAEVEFYSAADWNRLVDLSKSSGNGDEAAHAAAEMVENAKKIENIDFLLAQGRTAIGFKDLEDYVGAKGKYVAITKFVKISYPEEKLLDADIVDTPGFNDPVVSREQRSREFLERADVVIVVLYAGRPFDEQDRSLLFDQIRSAGTGKVVLLLNKYDLIIDDHGSEEKILEYVSKNIKQEIAKIRTSDPVLASVFDGSKIILFSSMLAILGKMDEADIGENEELMGYYDHFQDNFPHLTKNDYLEWSHLAELEAEIENIVRREKYEILVRKPITELLGKLKEKEAQLEIDIFTLNKEKSSFSKGLNKIKAETEGLKKARLEIRNLIDALKFNIENNIEKLCKEKVSYIRIERDNLMLTDLNNKLPEISWYQTNNSYLKICKKEIEDMLLQFRKLINVQTDDLGNKIRSMFMELINEFDQETTQIINSYASASSLEVGNLKKSFFNRLYFNYPEQKYTIELGISGFLGFWGVGKKEVIEYVRKEIDSRFSIENIEGIYMIGGIRQTALSKPLQDIGLFADQVIQPVLNALDNAERNLDERESRELKIDNEILAKQSELDLLIAKTAEIQDQLKQFTHE